MVSNGNVKMCDDKHCLNSAAVSELRIRSVRVDFIVKIKVYLFKEMTKMYPFHGRANETERYQELTDEILST
jgi:hypothetical protein